MTEQEFILNDRLTKIKSVIEQYGEDTFFIAFSGGKDSTVLSALVDLAIPNNKIPRVYANTGMEYKLILEFVAGVSLIDDRVIILKPTVNIKDMLNNVGYPFKSKSHSEMVARYQKSGKIKSVLQYLGEREDKVPWSPQQTCPKKLRYQFTDDFNLKVSDKCCDELKEKPVNKWAKENNKHNRILGIMASEGGRRRTAKCLVQKNNGKNIVFQPMSILTKEWEEWFIKEYNINICDIYKPPYNWERTGCKGCPFAKEINDELKKLEKYFPNERKQCEIIWKPVYDEYRRINYRLKGD